MPEVLSFQQVSKSFDKIHALSDLSFSVGAGEILAVVGANGAGKSTLMNLAAGLKQPSAGQVLVLGLDPQCAQVKNLRRALPQELHFPVHIKVKEVLGLVFSHYSEKCAQSLLEALDLHKLLERLTSELSGGERRKLGILCSLAGSPDLVLMDEPTANVDILGQAAIREILKKYFKSAQRSLVFSSHSLAEVESLADRVLVLSRGKIVANALTKDLRQWTGLKKINFVSTKRDLKLQSAKYLESGERGEFRAFGQDSDAMLRELLAGDSSAKEIAISWPSLEESILHLWANGGPH